MRTDRREESWFDSYLFRTKKDRFHGVEPHFEEISPHFSDVGLTGA